MHEVVNEGMPVNKSSAFPVSTLKKQTLHIWGANQWKDTDEALDGHEHGDPTEEADELDAEEDQCQYKAYHEPATRCMFITAVHRRIQSLLTCP